MVGPTPTCGPCLAGAPRGGADAPGPFLTQTQRCWGSDTPVQGPLPGSSLCANPGGARSPEVLLRDPSPVCSRPRLLSPGWAALVHHQGRPRSLGPLAAPLLLETWGGCLPRIPPGSVSTDRPPPRGGRPATRWQQRYCENCLSGRPPPGSGRHFVQRGGNMAAFLRSGRSCRAERGPAVIRPNVCRAYSQPASRERCPCAPCRAVASRLPSRMSAWAARPLTGEPPLQASGPAAHVFARPPPPAVKAELGSA